MLKVVAQTGEIFIYDVIGENWFGEGITGLSVANALSAIGSKRAIVRINSPGGIADEGIAIYNLLKRHAGGVDTHNDSLAASAASIIFLAGENRYAAKGSRVMIHRSAAVVWGNTHAVKKAVEMLDKYDQSLTEIYSEYTGKTKDETLTAMEAESWYTSEESVSAGFATAMTETESIKPNVASARFKNPPKSLVDDLKNTKQDQHFRYDAAAIAQNKMHRALLTR